MTKPWKTIERYVPLDGDRADDALADLDRLKKQYENEANVQVRGMVETRMLFHRAPKTHAKWCAVIAEAKRV